MDKHLIEEIRQMFRDGATPSMIMHHLEQRLGRSDRLHFMIRDYFREAFALPMLRHIDTETDFAPSLSNALFNTYVVAELIERVSEWNTASLDGSWLNGLKVHTLKEHKERFKGARFDGFSRIWNEMNEKERESLIQKVASSNRDWEIIKCLAVLTERLQEQVLELNSQLKSSVQRIAQ